MNETNTNRELLHEFNNFLTLCMTHAEVALESERHEDMASALDWILRGAQKMAPYTRSAVQHDLPFATNQPREWEEVS